MTLPFRLGLPTFIGKKCRNISYDLSVFGFSWMLLEIKLFNMPGDSGWWAQVRQLGHSLRSARAEASATNITICRFPTHTALRLLAHFEEMHLRCKLQLNSGSLGSKWMRGCHCALLTNADCVSNTNKALSWHMNSNGSPSPFLLSPCQRSSQTHR